MSLEELLKNRIIRKVRSNHKLAQDSVRHAERDVDTAKILIENNKFDWSLAVSYNAMLQAGRALMFDRGYKPSSAEGHVAVVKFLHEFFGAEVSDRMIMIMDGMRKKRHRIVYEEMDIVSVEEAERAVKFAEEFIEKVRHVLKL